MEKCKKCKSKNIVSIEYGFIWLKKEHPKLLDKVLYDGISEYNCQDCGYRQGRWSGKQLKDNELENRYGNN